MDEKDFRDRLKKSIEESRRLRKAGRAASGEAKRLIRAAWETLAQLRETLNHLKDPNQESGCEETTTRMWQDDRRRDR